MRKSVLYLSLFLGLLGGISKIEAQEGSIPLPSAPQLRWQQYEQIMFVHWSPATWLGKELDDNTYPITKINPKQLDTDQWCKVAKSWNAKMILFVAKHVGGFCWWQTNTTDYSIKNTPWKNGKGDVLKDLSESCKKYGLDLGVYIYPGDPHWGAGVGSGGITKDPSKQEAFNKIYRQQLTEILTKYGHISEVWFDGNCKIPMDDILNKYAKDAVVFQSPKASIRWVGSEEGVAPDPNWYTLDEKDLKTGISTALQSDVNGNAYAPVEVDVPILRNNGHKWFWAPNTDHLVLTVEQLMNLYYKSTGRGSVLLLNSDPDTTGLIPENHVKRYAEFGQEIRKRFDRPLKKTSGNGNELIISFNKLQPINHCIIQEKLEKGQRITSYEIDGLDTNNKWIFLCKGTSVGNKKIDFFETRQVKQVRLRILSSKAEPTIRNFSVYHVQSDLKDIQAMNNQEKAKVISSWSNKSFTDDTWTDFELDLTPYINTVGQYRISFNTVAHDFTVKGKTGLQFKDWELEMYGKKYPEGLSREKDKSEFLINRSQQVNDITPTKLKVKIKRNPSNSTGEITVQKIVY